MADLDVGRVVVVALEQALVVGAGADHGDRRQSGASGSTPSLVSTTTAWLAARRARARWCRGVEDAAGPVGVDVRALEQAEAELQPEDAAHGLVDHVHRRAARRATSAGSSAKQSVAGSSASSPARSAWTAASALVGGGPVVRAEQVDREVVGHHDAVEAELVAQEAGEDRLGRRRRAARRPSCRSS